MNPSNPKDTGTGRLFFTIVVVGTLGPGCGGKLVGQEGVADRGTPGSGGGDKGGSGGSPLGGLNVGGLGAASGGSPGNLTALPDGGTVGPESCKDPADYRCTTRLETQCWCDPNQPKTDQDCAPNGTLRCEYPLGCACTTPAYSAADCPNPAQFQPAPNGSGECDPFAPTSAADCMGSRFTCTSYDPPTDCRCFVGITK